VLLRPTIGNELRQDAFSASIDQIAQATPAPKKEVIEVVTHKWIRTCTSLLGVLGIAFSATSCSSGSTKPATVASTAVPPTTSTTSSSGVAGTSASPAALAVLQTIAAAPTITTIPSNLTPPLQTFSDPSQAKLASGVSSFGPCDAYGNPARALHPAPCLLGDAQASRTIVLVGDSNVGNWVPGLDLGLKQAGYRLAVFGFAGCPTPDLTYPSYAQLTPELLSECNEWHAATPPAIAALHPTAVIAASGTADMTAISSAQWIAGFKKLFDDSTVGAPSTVRILLGTSPFPAPGPTCLAAHPNPQYCALHDGPGSGTFYSTFLDRDPKIAAASGATLIRTYPWFCKSGTCSPIASNYLVFADKDHVSVAYSTFIAPVITEAVISAING